MIRILRSATCECSPSWRAAKSGEMTEGIAGGISVTWLTLVQRPSLWYTGSTFSMPMSCEVRVERSQNWAISD
jgi:hypothetical protein